MSLPAIPQNFFVQQGNGQVLVSWSLVTGALTYSVKRSTDGITYSEVATPAVNTYLDTTVTANTIYFYEVAAVNASGTSSYTTPQGIIPTLGGIMSLAALRLAAQQRADRVGSEFVTTPEWNFYINQSIQELYDLLITSYEDYNLAPPIYLTTNGSTFQYTLPNGVLQFNDSTGTPFTAAPFYKLLGVDLGFQNAPNGFVSVKKFNWIDRNQFVFPNTASTIYGVFNLRYRIMGNTIYFIPVPSGNQPIKIWYIPRLAYLLQDTDVLDGVSGWTQYPIIRAAKYALDKEESDTTKLDAELTYLKGRIEEAAMNRDAGQADTISDTRESGGGFGPMSGRSTGGW